MPAPDPDATRPRGLPLAWAVATALCVASAVQLARTYADHRAGGDDFTPLSADFLAPAALYEDVFVDGYPARGFQTSAATFAVPDVVLYFAVRAVAGSVGAAVLPWQAAQFALLVGCAWYALSGCAPRAARPWVGPAVVTVTAALLAWSAAQFLRTASSQLLIPVCHTGAQALAFASAGLLVRYVRGGGRGRLAGLAVVAAMAAFSDRLFALDFPVPAFLALGVCRLFTPAPRPPWARVFIPAACVGAGCLVGVAGLRFVPAPGVDADPLATYWAGITTTGVGDRAARLLAAALREAERGDVLAVSGLGWLVAAVPAAVRWRRLPAGVGGYGLASVVAFAAVGGVFLVSAAGVTQLGAPEPAMGEFGRYFAGPQSAALFGWALVVACVAGRGGAARLLALAAPAAAACVPLALTFTEARVPTRDLLDPYPEFVRAVDEVCRRRGLSHGFSGYFEAKPATYYSKAGVRVRALAYDPGNPNPFVPHVWLSNAAWYAPRSGEAPVQFVVARRVALATGDLPADAVRAYFGAPAEEVSVGNLVVMVYDRPADVRLREHLARTPEAIKLRYRLDPRARVRFPGVALTGGSGLEAGTARASGGPADPHGRVACGPDLRPRLAGPHAAEFRITTSLDAVDASVDVHYAEPDTRRVAVLAAAAVPAGTDGVVRLEFHVTREMLAGRGVLEFRTFLRPPGRLTLGHVDFGRVNE